VELRTSRQVLGITVRTTHRDALRHLVSDDPRDVSRRRTPGVLDPGDVGSKLASAPLRLTSAWRTRTRPRSLDARWFLLDSNVHDYLVVSAEIQFVAIDVPERGMIENLKTSIQIDQISRVPDTERRYAMSAIPRGKRTEDTRWWWSSARTGQTAKNVGGICRFRVASFDCISGATKMTEIPGPLQPGQRPKGRRRCASCCS
jgi:hypothetical protein